MSFLITFLCFFCYPTLILPEGDHDKLKKIREKKKTPKSRAITFWRACCRLVAILGARGFPCAVSVLSGLRPTKLLVVPEKNPLVPRVITSAEREVN